MFKILHFGAQCLKDFNTKMNNTNSSQKTSPAKKIRALKMDNNSQQNFKIAWKISDLC